MPQNVISVNVHSTRIHRFDEYFASLSPCDISENPWIDEFVHEFYNCSDIPEDPPPGNDDPNATMSLGRSLECDIKLDESSYYYQDESMSQVFDAFYAIAHGMNATMSSEKCAKYLNKTRKREMVDCIIDNLHKHMSDVSFIGTHGEREGVVFLLTILVVIKSNYRHLKLLIYVIFTLLLKV